MARALIVGCGCRGRMLGDRLLEEGWAVRGTSRDAAGLEAIEAAGIEPALADPDRPATLLDLVGDVTVVYWLLGSARGEPEDDRGDPRAAAGALHGEAGRHAGAAASSTRRGGASSPALLEEGRAIVRVAAATWRIPVEVVEADPS